MPTVEIRSRWTGAVLYTHETTEERQASGLALRDALESAAATRADLTRANLTDADLTGAILTGAILTDANLTRAALTQIRADYFDVLLRAPREVAGLRVALAAGRVNGSTYEGECACLVGTIAYVRGGQYNNLGNGIKPDSRRSIERWFMGIKKGDTPATNPVSALAVQWLDEFSALLAAATAPAQSPQVTQ